VSVTDARRYVADVLRSWGFDDEVVGDAELCTAELVTNAVLHAETSVDLTVTGTAGGARVEVRDRSDRPVAALVSTVAPGAASTLSDETMSGRGLLVVDGVAGSWGVDYDDGEKTVWFTIGDGGPGSRPEAPPEPEAAPDHSMLRSVRYVGVPVNLSVASGNNVDDLVREFQLLALDREEVRGVPASLIGDVERHLARSAGGRNASRVAAAAAMTEGRSRYDLDLRVGAGAADQLQRLNALLDEVADRCREGVLLTLPPSPEVTAFRRWCAEELRAQLEGADPTPCPFGG
jgi:anti-sigma regulatory factor (Ser/Thr protein kinase)